MLIYIIPGALLALVIVYTMERVVSRVINFIIYGSSNPDNAKKRSGFDA